MGGCGAEWPLFAATTVQSRIKVKHEVTEGHSNAGGGKLCGPHIPTYLHVFATYFLMVP